MLKIIITHKEMIILNLRFHVVTKTIKNRHMNLQKGLSLITGPIPTANWEATDGNKWTVPFGGGAGKIVRLGKTPFNLQAQAFYNAVKPEGAGGFSTRFQIQLMLPK